MTDYKTLIAQAQALVQDVPYRTANLANLAALIYHALSDVNWAGFYFRMDASAEGGKSRDMEAGCAEGGKLVLGPFQGNVACVEIPWGKGVCGTAAAEDKSLVVPDVHQFPGHIACDSASRSEIVVPIHGTAGEVIGVLDIDSPLEGRFTNEDCDGLEELVRALEEAGVFTK